MILEISSGAESDLAEGFWFYERQSIGLGSYFRSSMFADIESLLYFGGVHEKELGFHRALNALETLNGRVDRSRLCSETSNRIGPDLLWKPHASLALGGPGNS